MLGQVQEALSFAIEYYKGKSLVPKKLAMAMVDIFGAFCFNSGFSEKELRELEDIGMKLQEQALEKHILFLGMMRFFPKLSLCR